MLFRIRHFKLRKFIVFCVLIIILLNIYLLFNISEQTGENKTVILQVNRAQKYKEKNNLIKSFNTTELAIYAIEKYIHLTYSLDVYRLPQYLNYLKGLIYETASVNISLWEIAAKWVTKEQILPEHAPLLSSVLEALQKSPISKADVAKRGTQLKILLNLDHGQAALFKPKWYDIDEIIEGSVYSGKDRFQGEVISFHLGRLLKLNRIPIVTARTLNLNTEVIPVASSTLNETFLFKDENVCFYGVCYHCKKEDPVCGEGSLMEGSITLWLPEHFKLKKFRHPWQRTYNLKPALWETREDYCLLLHQSKKVESETLLLDLVEISVFDFLIDNGDRHHYERFEGEESRVFIIDNGKSFGNPLIDHIDILAPLYQCCKIRKSFVSVLVSLKNAVLSKWLKKILKNLNLIALLSNAHYPALDRRLNKALAAVVMCVSQFGDKYVLAS